MNQKEFLEMKEILRQRRERIKNDPQYAFDLLDRHNLFTPKGRKKALKVLKAKLRVSK